MSESLKSEQIQENSGALHRPLVENIRKFTSFDFEAMYGKRIKEILEDGSLFQRIFDKSRIGSYPESKKLPTARKENYPSTDESTREAYFEEDGWLKCSPASLRGHIASAHLQARTLASFGVARYDIEVAHYRKMSLEWVCKKIYQCLERTDQDIWNEIHEHGCSEFTHNDYRIVLIKNLLLIEQLECAQIDWERVGRIFPEYIAISLNLSADTHDASFYGTTLIYYREKIARITSESRQDAIEKESGAFLSRYRFTKK